jgi:hypothetical protein
LVAGQIAGDTDYMKNPEWDCQTWVMEALRWMKYTGLVTTDIGKCYIITELAAEKERWECADDTVEVRLFRR